MNDRDFLIWIHQRLEHVHHENPLTDYMHKLRRVIRNMSPISDSSHMSSCNSLSELKESMRIK